MTVPLALFTLAWGPSRAATSLAVGSASWMLRGLAPSPLINGLLPAVVSAPRLMPLPVERLLNASAGVPMAALRTGVEAVRLVGNTLACVLLALSKPMLQFTQALVLQLQLLAAVLIPRMLPAQR